MLNHDSKELQNLIAAFKSADETVKTVLLNTKADSIDEFKMKINKKLDSVSVSLMKKSRQWAKDDLPAAYKEGTAKVNGKQSRSLNAKASDVEIGYIQLARNVHSAVEDKKDLILDAIALAEKQDEAGAPIGRVRNIIEEELKKDNPEMVVKYANGAKMPLSSYAEMLARTSRIESSNTGAFDRCKQLGIDLVYCPPVPDCCPYCKKFEDKVYSISGNDKRFPALYETALQRGYNIMHPNCRHEFLQWHESFVKSPEELQEVIDKSNRFEDFDKNDKLFIIYNQGQAFLRQLNSEKHEFDRLSQELGDNMPYKTIGGFRRARRAKSETYMRTHRDITELGSAKKDGQILDFYERKGYNKEKAIERIDDLNRQYLEQVGKKKIKDIGFNAFAKTFVSASDRLVGQTTADGREIKGISIHFVERLFGDGTDGHKPVNLTKAIDTILTGKVRASTDESVLYEKNGIRVSFNTVKNSIIQCNIDGDKK